MTIWACAACQAQVAPGAPRCPECPSTSFIKPEAEAEMLKISRDGTVTDSADVQAKPFFGQLADVSEVLDEANAELAGEADEAPEAVVTETPDPAAEVPATEPQVPDAAPGPAPEPPMPPRVPPRRTPPPGAPGD